MNTEITADPEAFRAAGDRIRTQNKGIPQTAPFPDFLQSAGFHYALFSASEGRDIARVAAFLEEGSVSGRLGWYESTCNSGVAAAVLQEACAWLKRQGCTSVTGPMNGTTWHDYRFNLEADEPLFPGEPAQPRWYPAQWEHAGFERALEYETSVVEDHTGFENFSGSLQESLQSEGVVIHPYPESPDTRLQHILHRFYRACFRNNPLFREIPFEEFQALSEKAAPWVDYTCSFLLTGPDDEVIGAFVAYRDVQGERAGAGRSLFLKTIAVDSRWRNRSIGQQMIRHILACSHGQGYARTVFAMMFAGNVTAIRSKTMFGSRLLRKYALYRKEL